jgi:tRNA-specific 2-thiouridylase
VLGPEEELYSRRLVAHNVNWISGTAPREPLTARAKIRYKSREAEVTVFSRNDSVDVHFAQPQKAVTPGQAIVFYNLDEILGGGIIESAEIGA